MKTAFFTLSLCLLFSFKPSDPKTFESSNKKIIITADDTWNVKANMKGVEVFISKVNSLDNSKITIVVSKDEGLLPLTSLEKYSASKIFLQTSVLRTSPSITQLKQVNGINMKMYEYDYADDQLIQKHAIVYHAVIGNNGYQIVITGSPEIIKMNRPAYNEIINTIKIN